VDGFERLASPELDAERASGIEYFHWLPDDSDFGYPSELQ
jgi:hypothetical protein